MNFEKVAFAFFVLLALTLNFSFFVGDVADPVAHNVFELFAAIVVSLIATIMKFGDRTQLGALLIASSLVADLQLIIAAVVWGYAEHIANNLSDPATIASIVSLSGGAVLANIVSVVLLTAEALTARR
ncbi:MAG TPA: hypothetical protein ENI62_15840 [Gammaproteobacteria bacterium]|nr:hypothetical protein [Gammaproteobacteria bacterium]